VTRRRAGPAAAPLLVLLVVLGGCAERRLVSAPAEPPGAAAWTAVWCTGVLCAAVVGVLCTLPVWRERRGARPAVAVLTLQTGALAVTALVLVGVAIRSWQLVDHPLTEPPVGSLVRLSRIDGDGGFFALMVLLVVVLGTLVVALSATATRLAGSDDGLERLLACSVLAIELGGAGFCAVRLALGHGGWPFVGGTLAVPPLVVALVTAWPRPAATSVDPQVQPA
jgi:hypothetical protein